MILTTFEFREKSKYDDSRRSHHACSLEQAQYHEKLTGAIPK